MLREVSLNQISGLFRVELEQHVYLVHIAGVQPDRVPHLCWGVPERQVLQHTETHKKIHIHTYNTVDSDDDNGASK